MEAISVAIEKKWRNPIWYQINEKNNWHGRIFVLQAEKKLTLRCQFCAAKKTIVQKEEIIHKAA